MANNKVSILTIPKGDGTNATYDIDALTLEGKGASEFAAALHSHSTLLKETVTNLSGTTSTAALVGENGEMWYCASITTTVPSAATNAYIKSTSSNVVSSSVSVSGYTATAQLWATSSNAAVSATIGYFLQRVPAFEDDVILKTGFNVAATSLASTYAPTATYASDTNKITFGIPKGQRGPGIYVSSKETEGVTSTFFPTNTITYPSTVTIAIGDSIISADGYIYMITEATENPMSGTEYTCTRTGILPTGVSGTGTAGAEGLGIFRTSTSTSTFTTSIITSTITIPTDRSIKVGDLIIGNSTYSYLYRVTAVNASTVTVTYLQTLRGATGATGEVGPTGTSLYYNNTDYIAAQNLNIVSLLYNYNTSYTPGSNGAGNIFLGNVSWTNNTSNSILIGGGGTSGATTYGANAIGGATTYNTNNIIMSTSGAYSKSYNTLIITTGGTSGTDTASSSYSTTCSNNTLIGGGSGRIYSKGYNNLILGAGTGAKYASSTSSYNNIIIGAGTASVYSSNPYCIAIGQSTSTTGNYSIAIGYTASVGTSSTGSLAIGYGAKVGSSVTYAAELGNGTNNTSDSIAYRGRQIPTSTANTTSQAVINKILTITQAAYDALTTKNANTLYIIVG